MTNERLAEIEVAYENSRWRTPTHIQEIIKELIQAIREKDQTIKYLSGFYHEENGKD